MKKALVVALMLFVLPVVAGAYVVQGSLGTMPEVTFGTGHLAATPADYDARLVMFGSMSQHYSSYFVEQDPGEWNLLKTLQSGPSAWFSFQLWVTDLGAEGPSQQQWSISMSDQPSAWGQGWQEIYRGALFSATGTSSDPNFVYTSDFISSPVYIKLVAVPEPGSIAVFLSGLAGFAGLAIRRRK